LGRIYRICHSDRNPDGVEMQWRNPVSSGMDYTITRQISLRGSALRYVSRLRVASLEMTIGRKVR
jgi:hypothetical protein